MSGSKSKMLRKRWQTVLLSLEAHPFLPDLKRKTARIWTETVKPREKANMSPERHDWPFCLTTAECCRRCSQGCAQVPSPGPSAHRSVLAEVLVLRRCRRTMLLMAWALRKQAPPCVETQWPSCLAQTQTAKGMSRHTCFFSREAGRRGRSKHGAPRTINKYAQCELHTRL